IATLAPNSANRTAIACPIPEVPPVTRTFLPFSPLSSSLVDSGAVTAMLPPRGWGSFAGTVSAGRTPLQPREAGVTPAGDRGLCRYLRDQLRQPPDRRGGRLRGPAHTRPRAEVPASGHRARDRGRHRDRPFRSRLGRGRRGRRAHVAPRAGFPALHRRPRGRLRPPPRPAARHHRGRVAGVVRTGAPGRLRARSGRTRLLAALDRDRDRGNGPRCRATHPQGRGPTLDHVRAGRRRRLLDRGDRDARARLSLLLGRVGGRGLDADPARLLRSPRARDRVRPPLRRALEPALGHVAPPPGHDGADPHPGRVLPARVLRRHRGGVRARGHPRHLHGGRDPEDRRPRPRKEAPRVPSQARGNSIRGLHSVLLRDERAALRPRRTLRGRGDDRARPDLPRGPALRPRRAGPALPEPRQGQDDARLGCAPPGDVDQLPGRRGGDRARPRILERGVGRRADRRRTPLGRHLSAHGFDAPAARGEGRGRLSRARAERCLSRLPACNAPAVGRDCVRMTETLSITEPAAAGARSGYLPIAEHGVIGDLRTVALVGSDGTIDWYCPGRFDAPSVFGAILDRRHGGRYAIAPAHEGWTSRQLYFPETNILITRFLSEEG